MDERIDQRRRRGWARRLVEAESSLADCRDDQNRLFCDSFAEAQVGFRAIDVSGAGVAKNAFIFGRPISA